MHVPPHASLHFRTRLILRLDAPDRLQAVMAEVRESVRRWAVKTLPQERERFASPGFEEGGLEVVSLAHGAQLRTLRAAIDDRSNGTGGIWAVQARTTDPRFDVRFWAHEAALAPVGPDALRLSIRVRHWMTARMGWRPPEPAPEPPDYLWRVAGIPGIRLTDGYDCLPLVPETVTNGSAPDLVKRLEDPERRSPILYMSVTRPGDRPLIDPSRLMRAVAFMAPVLVAQTAELDRELDHFLPDGLRCYGGAVRMYRPGLRRRRERRGLRDHRDEDEGRRHRYLSPSHLRERPTEASLLEISREVAAALPVEDREREPVTLDEVEAAGARVELDRLREETRELRARARGGLSPQESSKLLALTERLEDRVRRLEDENRRMAGELFRHSEEEAEESGGEAEEGAAGLTVKERAAFHAFLRELPSTPAECLELAAALYPDRILVTDRALKSAGDATLEDPRLAWRLLMAMVGTLYPLHFGDGGARRSALEIRDAFRNNTPFDIAFTETKATKASGRLLNERRLLYRGEEVDLVWHVKYGSRPPRLLRVHYHPDSDGRLLVIGHFGDHLETAGTARRG
jgi:hypothetical protein